MGKKSEIEPKIKPLVEILNDVPYIKTKDSCEGHFESGDKRKHKAFVRFDVHAAYESELSVLLKKILSDMQPAMWQVKGQLLKRYQVIEKTLETDYKLEIIPFGYDSVGPSDNKDNRENTDLGIRVAIDSVKKYLETIRKDES